MVVAMGTRNATRHLEVADMAKVTLVNFTALPK